MVKNILQVQNFYEVQFNTSSSPLLMWVNPDPAVVNNSDDWNYESVNKERMQKFYGNQLTESLKSEAGKTFGQIVRFSCYTKL